MTSPSPCPCLRCLLLSLSRHKPYYPLERLSCVLANGKAIHSAPSKIPPMAEWILSQNPSFSDWELAPLISGDLSSATYVNRGEGFVRQLQLKLPASKLCPIPPLECRYATNIDINNDPASPRILPR